MNGRQSDRFNMYHAVKDTIGKHLVELTILPDFPINSLNFYSLMTQIEAQGGHQAVTITGSSDAKQQARDIMVTHLEETARRTASYAKLRNNPTLLAEMNISLHDLKSLSANDVVDKAHAIYNSVDVHVGDLAPFGVLPATQTVLLNSINDFIALIAAPRGSILSRKQATDELKLLFDKADAVLELLDATVNIIKTSSHIAYNDYRNARKVIATNGGVIAVSGTVTEADTAMPVSNVRISITGEGRNVADRYTTDMGHFEIHNLPGGTYSLTAHREGYRDFVTPVYVTNTMTSLVNVHLSKLGLPI